MNDPRPTIRRSTATDRPYATSRRSLLAAAGAAVVGSVAGCTALGRERPEGVTLPPPENYDRLKEVDLPYPTYGDDLPEATVPGVLRGGEVSTREFVGERHLLLTFVYTRCTGICLGLGANLVQVQARAAEEGFSDEIALAATTFDPAHDTPERLRAWGKERGLDFAAGNVHLLRPGSPERARAVVEGTFGEAFEHRPEADMPFLHTGLILLANDRGVVERAYSGDPPNPKTVVDDVTALVEA